MTREFAVVPAGKAAHSTLLVFVFGMPLMIALGLLVSAPQGAAPVAAWPYARVLVPVALIGALLIASLRWLRVRLDDGELRLRAGLYSQRVRVKELDLDAARVVDLDGASPWAPKVRINGFSLPGVSLGYFRGRPWTQKLFCLLTSRQRVLVLPRRDGRALLLSLERPQALLDALRALAPR